MIDIKLNNDDTILIQKFFLKLKGLMKELKNIEYEILEDMEIIFDDTKFTIIFPKVDKEIMYDKDIIMNIRLPKEEITIYKEKCITYQVDKACSIKIKFEYLYNIFVYISSNDILHMYMNDSSYLHCDLN